MVIKNKLLDIDTNIVNQCTDREKLKEWASLIQQQLASLNITVSTWKSKSGEGVFVDRERYNSMHSAIKLQGILRLQIQTRLSVLKSSQELNIERAFILVAKSRLTHELYVEIAEEARNMIYNKLL